MTFLAALAPADAPAMTDAEWEGRNGRIRAKHYIADVCDTIGRVAERKSLPQAFLTKLIWQESRFNAGAVSPKGAQGIAQFMPTTAKERGLLDPFSAIQGLRAAADFLADLRAEFGNLGLAAAAYNAGPQRVKDWLSGKRTLPGETRDYVLLVTGTPADAWTNAQDAEPAEASAEFTKACVALASSRAKLRGLPSPRPRVVTLALQDSASEPERRRATHVRTRPRAAAQFCATISGTGATCRSVHR